MGDHGNQDDLTAALAIIQQQMQAQQQRILQMQQTIQNQQQAAQEAVENAAREERALCLDAAGRVSGRTGRGRGVNFVTLAGSSLTRHVALPDHGVGLDGQSCSCLIVGWPVGLSSPTLGDDQQEVSYLSGQGWQLKNYHPNPNVRNNPQLFWPKQDKPPDPAQRNQATSAPVAVLQDETKAMLQQLLQGQQLQGKALNQGKQKESEQPPADAPAAEKEREPTVGTNSPEPEQPAEAARPIPEPVPTREYTPKVPYPVPAKATRQDREEMKCRKMLEDLTVRLPLMDEYGKNGGDSKSGGREQQRREHSNWSDPFTELACSAEST
ncbi:hypothetical protein DY000_02006491 [Brassica cretica]|uniref:Uncharacterized protein n=1 Tax=Brassica cretica TaxID=69181 RepID=A0ABQ7C4T5_BRACR|nr:hypothetical protein DY000_02006491 [Brassica cretica]